MEIEKKLFANLNDRPVYSFTLKNDHGMELTCIEYGCIVTKLLVPDREGKLENVVLGYEKMQNYLDHSPYFGAIAGRVAGRIKEGKFTLDGKEYQLEKNMDNHHMHGGSEGFSHKIWAGIPEKHDHALSVTFHYISRSGEEGYPGTVNAAVTYTLTNQNEVLLRYTADTDEPTILNMTNHTYFNLSGGLDRSILQHELFVNSDSYLELNEESLPTGKLASAEGTPFDFRSYRKLKDGKESDHPQTVLAGGGFDHPLILNDGKDEPPIVLVDRKSGRVLEIATDQPCVVLFTSSQMKDDAELQEGVQVQEYLGVCLETQKHPDAVHHDHFPSIVVREDETYEANTKWTFKTE
ncbi:galactose mutarotase [Metabacillus sp. GX 13764]|uniref:aldose epimerase family protein n=1 Tax=Metabacillus kandeliae TaxID=2900151 RepID=UPI001E54A922|nr:aldose epimerase family protein [Metabacillus kandeliae]MCD7035534.1 galactose mutarotase [Metabacillus kandeliae]